MTPNERELFKFILKLMEALKAARDGCKTMYEAFDLIITSFEDNPDMQEITAHIKSFDEVEDLIKNMYISTKIGKMCKAAFTESDTAQINEEDVDDWFTGLNEFLNG